MTAALISGEATAGARTGAPVLVADGDPEARRLLRDVLGHAGFTTLEAAGGSEALELARRERPAAVLLETCLEDLNGYEVLRELRAEFGPNLPVVFVSARRIEAMDRTAGLMLGADDYIVKPYDPGELVARVRRLVVRPARTNGSRGSFPEVYRLSPREVEILRLLAQGESSKQIALELHLSRKTVSNHKQRIFGKLGVHSQAQAVAAAYRLGLIEPDVHAHVLGSSETLAPVG